jgi:hypothetical protein
MLCPSVRNDDPLLTGTAIHWFDAVVATGNKLLRAAKVRASTVATVLCTISVAHLLARYIGSGGRDCYGAEPGKHLLLRHGYCMSHLRSLIDCSHWQDRRRHRLGLTRPTPFEKTLFSMATPEVLSLLNERGFKSLVLMGIEVRRSSCE